MTAPSDLASLFLARPLADFGEPFPDLQLELLLTDRALDFDADRIDVVLSAGIRLPDPSLIARGLRVFGLGGAFFDVTAAIRLAMDYAHIQDEYRDGVVANN